MKQIVSTLYTVSSSACLYSVVDVGYYCGQGIARTQSPLRKNYALESPAFGVIAGVSQTGVQWKGLALGGHPS